MGVLIAMAALAAQAAAAEPRWEPLAEEGGVAMAIDPASIARSGATVRFTLRGSTQRPQPDGSTSGLMELEVDCTGRSGTLHGGRSFLPDGQVAQETRIPPAQRQAQPLRSASALDQAIYARVCGGALAPDPAGAAQ